MIIEFSPQIICKVARLLDANPVYHKHGCGIFKKKKGWCTCGKEELISEAADRATAIVNTRKIQHIRRLAQCSQTTNSKT